MDLSKLIFMPQVNAYDGNYEVDFDEWLENLTNFFEAFMPNLTDEQKILHLKTYLSGQAREKFKEIDLTTATTFKDVLARLKELCQSEVGRSLGLLKLSLMNPKEPNEDLDDFVEKFRKTVKQATIGLEEDFVKMKMLDEFILKLDPEMAYYVRDKEPKDFNTAVEYAKKHEILSKLRKINIMKSSINLLKNPNLKEDEIIDELADCLAERLRLYGPGRNSSSSNNCWHDINDYDNDDNYSCNNEDFNNINSCDKIYNYDRNRNFNKPNNFGYDNYTNDVDDTNANRYVSNNFNNGDFNDDDQNPSNKFNNSWQLSNHYPNNHNPPHSYQRFPSKPICTYCNKRGHDAQECYARIRDNANYETEGRVNAIEKRSVEQENMKKQLDDAKKQNKHLLEIQSVVNNVTRTREANSHDEIN